MYATGSTRPGIWSRLIHFFGPKGVLVWMLLLITLLSIITGLAEVIKGLEFGYALVIMLMAATSGWLLAAFPIPGWLGGMLGVLLGVELVLLRVGRLEGVLFKILDAVFSLFFEVVAWVAAWIGAIAQAIYVWEPIVPVTRAVRWARLPNVYFDLFSSLQTLVDRTGRWILSLFSGSGVFDPVATAVVWGLVLWAIAWWAGWVVNRRQAPLLAILPGGVLLSFILGYAWESTTTLLPMVGFTFLLMALARQRGRENRWQVAGIDFSHDLWSDLLMTALLVSFGLVALAAISPAITVERFQDIVEWINELTIRDAEDGGGDQQVAKSLGIEQQPQPRSLTPIERAQVTTLPRRHLIGSGEELSRLVVMVVNTGELPPIPDLALLEEEIPRHYWRSITYNRYYGQGWATTNTSITKYEAAEAAITSDVPYHRILRQKVQMIGPWTGTLHVDGKLVSVDQPFEIHWRPPTEIFAATTDQEVETYRADSLIMEVTDEDLRAAPPEIPDWIQEPYLQLPEDLPNRVRDLAFELTATEPTAYDRAKAIEQYLRAFPYALDVEMPPYGRDIADYFLFELQEGYCDYYATSMVVLARAAGLPARLVIGYASGSYNPESGRYIVTEADAHAWPEIYFSGIGWVEFEPTGTYPEFDRAAYDVEDYTWPEGVDLEPLAPPQEETESHVVLGVWVLAAMGGVLGVILSYSALDSLFLLVWRRPIHTVTRLYHRLQKYRDRLRARSREGQTPYEVAMALVKRILEISEGRDLAEELLPDAEDEIQILVELYIQAWYTQHTLTQRDRRYAVWMWWRLRWRLWLARLWRSPRRERPPMPVAVAQPEPPRPS